MSKLDTKNRILDTASKLFYEKSFNLIGINEIIESSGIAKATLYNHFKSKEDLAIAYLEKRDQELLENLKIFCSRKKLGHNRLIAILEFLVDFFNDKKFNGCWCLRTLAEVPRENKRIRNKIKANKTALLQYIASMVGENAPQLKKAASKDLSKTIYLLYEASVAESHLHQDVWPIQHSIKILKSMLKEL